MRSSGVQVSGPPGSVGSRPRQNTVGGRGLGPEVKRSRRRAASTFRFLSSVSTHSVFWCITIPGELARQRRRRDAGRSRAAGRGSARQISGESGGQTALSGPKEMRPPHPALAGGRSDFRLRRSLTQLFETERAMEPVLPRVAECTQIEGYLTDLQNGDTVAQLCVSQMHPKQGKTSHHVTTGRALLEPLSDRLQTKLRSR